MGLENSQGTFTFLGVYQGKLTQRVKEGTEHAIERETKTGKKIWELTYDKLSGRLTGIEFREGDYGKEIHFIVADGPEKFKLQLPYSSKVAKSIIMRLPNCDLTKEIEIHTGLGQNKDGKESSFSYITQNGATVKSAYTKELPNGMPPMKQIKVKGQEVWDDSEQLEFLDAMLIKDILPQLGQHPASKVDDIPATDTDDNVTPENDLPF